VSPTHPCVYVCIPVCVTVRVCVCVCVCVFAPVSVCLSVSLSGARALSLSVRCVFGEVVKKTVVDTDVLTVGQ
jgi:hypothetical protein